MGRKIKESEEFLHQDVNHLEELVESISEERNRSAPSDSLNTGFNEKLLESLTESANEMLILIDDEHIIRYINKSALRLTEKPHKNVLGEQLGKILPGKVYHALSKGINQALQTEEQLIHEEQYSTSSGEVWINTLFLPILTADSSTVHVLILARDVTEKRQGESKIHQTCVNLQKMLDEKTLELQEKMQELQHAVAERIRAEEETHRAMERYGALIDNVPGAVYRCSNDKYWTMDFLSDKIEDITGYPAEEFLRNGTRSYASIIIESDLLSVADAVERGVRQQRPYEMRYRVLDASGRIRHFYEKGQGIYANDGALICLEGIIFDVSHWVEYLGADGPARA